MLDSEDYTVGNLRITHCEFEDKEEIGSCRDNKEKIDSIPPARNSDIINVDDILQLTTAVDVDEPHLKQLDAAISGTYDYCEEYKSIKLSKISFYCSVDGFGQTDLSFSNLHVLSTVNNAQNIRIQTNIAMYQIYKCLQSLQNIDISVDDSTALQQIIAGELSIDESIKLVMGDICFVHLYLSDMNDFSEMNSEYSKWFGSLPPSRACLAMPLPSGVLLAVEVVFLKGSYVNMSSHHFSRRQVSLITLLIE